MAVLESKLIIGASDETGAAFASVMARINELQGRLASVSGALGGFTPPPSVAAPSRATMAATAAVAPFAATAAPSRATIAATSAAAPAASVAAGFWDTVGQAALFLTGVKAITGAFHEAMEQQHERMRQEVAAMTPEEIAKGEKMGADIAARYPSVPQSEVMHSLRTARTVTGSYEEAENIVEPLTRLRVIAQATRPGESSEDMREEFDKLVKALEIAGVATDDKKLHSYINDIAKSLNAFGDQLKPEDYFDMLRYGRQASSKISERFLMTTLATLGTEFGGSNIGTALSGFNQAVVGNRFTHTAALGFVDMGLIPDQWLARTKTGEIKGIKPGGHVKDWELAQTDPDLWIKQDLLPAMAAKGITGDNEIAARIGQLFSNRNAANLVTQIALQQKKLEKNAGLWNLAEGLKASDLLGSRDAMTALSGVGNSITRAIAQWYDPDLFGQLGGAVNKALGSLTRAPSHRGDLSEDLAIDAKGWTDLFKSIRVGGPQTSEQWRADMRANASLWGAGYRPGDLEQELAREHGRAASSSPAAFRGASDWEVRSQGLTMPAPAAPQQQTVSVSGQADVSHTIHLDVTLDPALRAKIDQISNALEFTVPLLGGGHGRIDSDAGPHRAGIGHM